MQTFIQLNAARLAGLLALSAALTACGGGGGSEGSANATAANESSVTPAASAANHAPTIQGAAVTSINVGQAYNFVPNAADVDGDSLSFTISSKPAWATFDPATGRLSGVPASANVGSYEEIEIGVSDGKSTTKLAQFTITVAAGSVASTENVTVSWSPPTTNTDGTTLTNLNGYRILYGVKPGVYTESVTVGAGITRYTIENISSGAKYYIAMVAVNSTGAESEKSQEVLIDLM